MLLSALVILLQGQLVFGQVQVVQNCIWQGTANPSIQNIKIDFYAKLAGIPATAPVFAKYRISVIGGNVAASTTQPPQPTTASVTFLNVPTISDYQFTFLASDKNCITWEVEALREMVALNNAQVDALLVEYKVRVVAPDGTQVFPRP